MSEIILCEDHDRIRVLSINRPGALNAMNNAVFQGIAERLAEAEESSNTAVVIITGIGKAFCAGQDLEEFQVLAQGGSAEHQFPHMLKQLTNFKKPLIAAVNGLGVGIGMTMLAHCDLVLMAKDARLKTPFPQLGLAPEAGSSCTFIERMGWQNAAYTLLSGRWFSAVECLEMGLVWRLEEAQELMPNAMALASEIAANPIPSLIATKELMLASGRPHDAWAAHQRESKVYEELLGAPANNEALAAFVEKREANFANVPGI
jgi:enoyl-CoA hydratase/carnithine racemase